MEEQSHKFSIKVVNKTAASSTQFTKGTRLYGAPTLVLPVLLWPFMALPILLLIQFEADLFGVNFTKIIFCVLFQFISVFLIYKKLFF